VSDAWRARAECLNDHGANAAFHDCDDEGNPRPAMTMARDAFCRVCPVRTQCLDYAIAAKEKHAMFGGASPAQLKAMVRRRTPHCVLCGRPLTRVEVIDNWDVAAKRCGEH
jgi:WhiB family redox-sensing transcriptional regulator